jgi:hypothetical protein
MQRHIVERLHLNNLNFVGFVASAHLDTLWLVGFAAWLCLNNLGYAFVVVVVGVAVVVVVAVVAAAAAAAAAAAVEAAVNVVVDVAAVALILLGTLDSADFVVYRRLHCPYESRYYLLAWDRCLVGSFVYSLGPFDLQGAHIFEHPIGKI